PVAAALLLDNLGHDAHGDLFRRLGAQLQPHGRLDAGEERHVYAVFAQQLFGVLPAAAAADDANVGRRRFQNGGQDLAVDEHVAREQDDEGRAVNRLLFERGLNWARQVVVGFRHVLGRGQLLAVVGDDYAVAQPVGQRGDGFAHVPGADDVDG